MPDYETKHASLILSPRQKKLGLSPDKVVVSRSLTQLFDVMRLSKEPAIELYPLTPQEEMILDCIVDSASKGEVLQYPEFYAKTKSEIMTIVKNPVINNQTPWRMITEDEIRSITGKLKKDELSGRMIEQVFTSMVRRASFHGKCKCVWFNNKWHEIELLHAPLFVEVLVHREGVASRRMNIPEESKKKRIYYYRLNQPYATLIFSDIARGRFGSFPRGFHLMDWGAQRIARYYELFRGRTMGVNFSYLNLLKLLETPDVVDVGQKLDQLERFLLQVEVVMSAVMTKKHRGRDTVFNLKDTLILTPPVKQT